MAASWDKYLNYNQQPKRNLVSAAVSSGVDQLQGLGYSALGGLADMAGATSVRDWANERADLNQWEAQRNGRPDLERLEDQTLGTALPFAAYQVVKQLPMMGAVMGAQLVPGLGQAASATGLARLGAVAPRMLGGGGLEAGASIAARRAALEQGTSLATGTMVGTGLGFGSLYGESVESGDPSPFKALALAPLYGAAEAVLPGVVQGGLRLPQQFAGKTLSRMGKSAMVGGVGETGTELFQNELEMGIRSDLSDDDKFSRRLNSAVVGGLAGGAYGSLGGLRKPIDPVAPTDLLNLDAPPTGETLQLGYSPVVQRPNTAVGEFTGQPITELPRAPIAEFGEYDLLGLPSPTQPAQTTQDLAQPGVINVTSGGTAAPMSMLSGQQYDLFGGPDTFGTGQVPQTDTSVDKPADTLTGDLFDANPSAMVRTMFNPAEPGSDPQLGPTRTGNRGSVVGNIRSQIAQRAGDAFDPAMGQLLAGQLSGSVGDLAQMRALLDARAQAVQKNIRSLERKVDDGSNLMSPEELAPKMSALENKLLTIEAARGVVDQYQRAQTQALAEEGRAKAQPGSTVVNTPNVPDSNETAVNQALEQSRETYLNDRIPETDRAVAQGAADRTQQDRLSILRGVLDAPARNNPVDRFVKALAAAGYKNLAVTTAEQEEINRVTKRKGDVLAATSPTAWTVRGLGNMPAVDMQKEGADVTQANQTQQSSAGRAQEAAPAASVQPETAQADIPGAGAPDLQTDGLTTEGVTDVSVPTTPVPGAGVSSDAASPDVAGGVAADGRVSDAGVGSSSDAAGVPAAATAPGVQSDGAVAGPTLSAETLKAQSNALIDQINSLKRDAQSLMRKDGREPYAGTSTRKARDQLLDRIEKLTEAERAIHAEYVRLTKGKVDPQVQSLVESDAKTEVAADTQPTTPRVVRNKAAVGKEADLAVLEADLAIYNSPNTGGTGQVAVAKHLRKVREAAQRIRDAANDPEESPEVRARAQEILDNDIDPKDLGDPVRWSNHNEKNPDNPLPTEQIAQIAQKVLERLGLASRVRIEVYRQPSELRWSTDSAVVPSGVTTSKGNIIIFGDAMGSGVDVVRTVFHELFHQGLAMSAKPSEYTKLMMRFLMDPLVRKYAMRWKGTEDARSRRGKTPQGIFEAIAVEEALADIAEDLSNDRIGSAVKNTFVRNFLRALTEFLDAFDSGKKISQAIRRMTLNDTEKFVMDMIGRAENTSGKQPMLRHDRLRTARAENPPTKQAQIPKALRTPLDNIAQFAKDLYSRAGLEFGLTRNILEKAAVTMPAATKYMRLADEATIERMRSEKALDDIKRAFQALPKGEQTKVNSFLMESTYKRKWGYVPTWIPAKVEVDPQVAAMLPESPATRAVIDRVFKHSHDNLHAMQKSIIDSANSDFDAEIGAARAAGDKVRVEVLTKEKARQIKRYRDILDINSYWPYAPLKRFGAQAVVGMSQAYLDNREAAAAGSAVARKWLEENESDSNHYVVMFVDTKGEARKAVEQLQKTGKAYADFFERLDDYQALYGGSGVFPAFQRLRSAMKASQTAGVAAGELNSKVSEHIDKMIQDIYLNLLSETSARHAGRTRRDVAGADGDMMRAFVSQGRATAHFIAAIKTNGQVSDALMEMKAQADKHTPGRSERSELFNEIVKRHGMGLEYQPSPFMDKALAVNSFWTLLSNPAYFATNGTQPWLVTLPVLAGKHGMMRSAAALKSAYADALPLFKHIIDGTVPKNATAEQAELLGMLKVLQDRGRIDISLEMDLSRFRTEDGPLGKLADASDKLRGIAERVEMVNRVATAIAAYRLETQRKASPDSAIDYAEKLILDTHGDYSGFNAPRHMRTTFGRAVTQFRKFQLIQLALMHKLLKEAFGKGTKEEKDAAKAALMYTIGVAFAAGGVMAVPGFTAISFLLGAFGDDDTPDDPEATMRRWLKSAGVDNTLADALIKGVPKMLGLDLSGRIGMGGMLSILPYTDIEGGRDGYEKIALGMLGPMLGGTLPRAYDGATMIAGGDYWKGIEKLMPRGLTNAMQGVRLANEGMTTRKGEVVLAADEVSFLAAAGQALGLPPESITDSYFVQSAKFKADAFFADKTSQLKKQYVDAYKSNDSQARAEVMREWQSIQESRKALGYTTQPLSTLLKAPMESAKQERNVVGGAGYVERNKRFVQSTAELVN